MARAIGSQILIEIGENIRKRREETGMSQMTLGFAIGTDAHAVSRYENATRELKAERICDIADALQAITAQGRKVLRNRANDVRMEFPQEADGGDMASITRDGRKFSWRFEQETQAAPAQRRTGAELRQVRLVEKARGMAKYVGRTLESLQSADLAAEIESAQEQRMDLPALRAENRYDEVLPGVSVRYELRGDALKEDIILENEEALSRAAIRLPDDFDYRVTEGQEMNVLDRESGETLFTMDAPLVYDAEGRETAGGISLTPCGEYTRLEYEIPPEFLESAVWPVTIDPAIRYAKSRSNIKDAGLYRTKAPNTPHYKADALTGGGAFLRLTSGSVKASSAIVQGSTAASSCGPGAEGWERVSVTANASAGSVTLELVCGVSGGTAYFACPQLEVGEIANRANLLTNGDFTRTEANGSRLFPVDWSAASGINSSELNGVMTSGHDMPDFLSGNALRMVSFPARDGVGFTQTIPVSGAKDDVYVIGGWLKACEEFNANSDQYEIEYHITNAESDVQKQIDDVNALIELGCQAICLHSVDTEGCKPAVDACKAAGVYVVEARGMDYEGIDLRFNPNDEAAIAAAAVTWFDENVMNDPDVVLKIGAIYGTATQTAQLVRVDAVISSLQEKYGEDRVILVDKAYCDWDTQKGIVGIALDMDHIPEDQNYMDYRRVPYTW